MHKRLFFKAISSIAAMAMAVSVLGACSQTPDKANNGETTAAPTTAPTTAQLNADEPGWKKDTSPITITWFTAKSTTPSEWGTDVISAYIKEKTGVHLEITQPVGNADEKVNLMIASNDLPDVIEFETYRPQVQDVLKGKMVYSLNELADKYDPYFYKAVDMQKFEWNRQSDGNVYGYPGDSYSPSQSASGATACLVRKDIYEAIGKPDMRTPEGFLKALQDAKEKFPNGLNGQPLVPLGTMEWGPTGNGSLGPYTFRQMLALPVEVDGKFAGEDSVKSPEYVRWLKTFRKANEMGLISKEIFTDKKQQIDEKALNGRYFCFLNQRTNLDAANRELVKTNPESVYICVDAVANSNLDKPIIYGSSISGYMMPMITKDCKNPERTIKFFSYLISHEGQMDLQYGIEGKTYENTDKGPMLLPEINEMYARDNKRFLKEIGGATKYYFFADPTIKDAMKINVPSLYDFDPILYNIKWNEPYTVNSSTFVGIAAEKGTPEEKAFTEVYQKWGEVQPKLILAETEEEMMKLYDDYIKEYDRLMPVFNEFATKVMNERKQKLGIK